MTSTLFAALATIWGLSGGPAWGAGITGAVAFGIFFWAVFCAWRAQYEQVAGGRDFARVATAFRETWESAREMWHKGTVGCHSGTEADAWLIEYDAWLQAAKDRITRDAGADECTAVFGIGSTYGLSVVDGHNPEHTRRLSYLKHHMEQLHAALKRYLPSQSPRR